MKTENRKSVNPDRNKGDDIPIKRTSVSKIVPKPANNMYFDFDIIGNETGIQGTESSEDQEVLWDEYREVDIFNSLRGDYVDPDDYNSE